MKASTVRAVFDELREQLVPMVQAITAQPPADVSCLQRDYPRQAQEAFFVPVIRALAYFSHLTNRIESKATAYLDDSRSR
jgi:carboxypeptidase Taq